MRLPSFLKMPALVFEPNKPFSIKPVNHVGKPKWACQGSACKLSCMVLATCANVSKPTTSAVRKVADLGRPKRAPVKSSTTSKRKPYFSALAMVASMENTPMRLATKLGVSLARTTPLPKVDTKKRSKLSKTAASVSLQAINSTKCM